MFLGGMVVYVVLGVTGNSPTQFFRYEDVLSGTDMKHSLNLNASLLLLYIWATITNKTVIVWS